MLLSSQLAGRFASDQPGASKRAARTMIIRTRHYNTPNLTDRVCASYSRSFHRPFLRASTPACRNLLSPGTSRTNKIELGAKIFITILHRQASQHQFGNESRHRNKDPTDSLLDTIRARHSSIVHHAMRQTGHLINAVSTSERLRAKVSTTPSAATPSTP